MMGDLLQCSLLTGAIAADVRLKQQETTPTNHPRLLSPHRAVTSTNFLCHGALSASADTLTDISIPRFVA